VQGALNDKAKSLGQAGAVQNYWANLTNQLQNTITQNSAPQTGTTGTPLIAGKSDEHGIHRWQDDKSAAEAASNDVNRNVEVSPEPAVSNDDAPLPQNAIEIAADQNWRANLKALGFDVTADGRIFNIETGSAEDANSVAYGTIDNPGSYHHDLRQSFNDFAKNYKKPDYGPDEDDKKWFDFFTGASKVDEGAVNKANASIRANQAQNQGRILRGAMEMAGRAGTSADYAQGVVGDVASSMSAQTEAMTNANNLQAAIAESQGKAQAAMMVYQRATDKEEKERALVMAQLMSAQAVRQQQALDKQRQELEDSVSGGDVLGGILAGVVTAASLALIATGVGAPAGTAGLAAAVGGIGALGGTIAGSSGGAGSAYYPAAASALSRYRQGSAGN
jgi:preprotein translocase subunit YajC